MSNDITTTAGEIFTEKESVQLLRLVFKRFGRNIEATTAAWRRLLQNGATEEDMAAMLYLADKEQ